MNSSNIVVECLAVPADHLKFSFFSLGIYVIHVNS